MTVYKYFKLKGTFGLTQVLLLKSMFFKIRFSIFKKQLYPVIMNTEK